MWKILNPTREQQSQMFCNTGHFEETKSVSLSIIPRFPWKFKVFVF
jgi:hypothetical protein